MRNIVESIPTLKEAGPEAIAAVAEMAEWFSLPGGWALFHAGEEPEALHFVIAGGLVVVADGVDETDRLVGYVRAGEPVGEMALISGGTHSASVYALRDTELLRIPRAAYEKLWRQHPVLIQILARGMLNRVRKPRTDMRAQAPKVFSLIALSPSIVIDWLAEQLAGHIRALGKTCIVLREDAVDKPTAFFEEMEQKTDVLFLVGRLQDTAWLRQMLRQADRLWVFARRDARPSTPMPLMPDSKSVARRFRLVDLVYINEGSYDAATPNEWMNAVGATRLFRWQSDSDAARIARVMAGRSVGLVLSGGGARAYAHIGVLNALRDMRVPIDFIGGTSMGAVVGAGIALGWSDSEMDMRIRDAFVASNPLGDHRLPVVALTRGKLVEERFIKHFGDAKIEELKLPFFCVSTDLMSGSQRIHRTGLLRDALRASVSLPGILPPVVSGRSVLVDGAVLNNFPIDIMKSTHRGPTIGIDVAQQDSINPEDFKDPPGFLSWILKNGFSAAPPIVSLLMRTATLGVDQISAREAADILVLPELGNVEIRNWKAYDAAVAAGYEATVKMLQEDASQQLPRLPIAQTRRL